MPPRALTPFELPRISKRRLRLFERYVRFYLRRHFHGVHLLRLSPPVTTPHAVMICLNHPAWWDPLLAVHLSQRFFPERVQYAPIAAKGLEKYRFFEKLGFFGIDPESRGGAQRFLEIGRAVLTRPDGVLWVTAQGHFTDVRVRPVELSGGLGHLAHEAQSPFVFLPIALEYAFWEERTPEAFVCWGEAEVIADGPKRTAREWTARFAAQLEATQNTLARQVLQRNAAAFEPMLGGAAGVGGVYDAWRAVKAMARGKRFRSEHGGTAS